MKNIIRIASIIILVVSATGCNDDFMERFPKTSIAPENFFNTESDLQMYIYGLYNFGTWGHATTDAYNTTDDAVTTGVSEIKTIMTSGISTSRTITSGWDWGQLRSINFFLAHFRNADISDEKLNHYEGLARFFRARFYYDKILRYNDVPWIDIVLETNSEELFAAQNPRAFVVDKIMEDLKFAADWVEETAEIGAINRWVVLTFYARVALAEGSFRRYHDYLNLSGTAEAYFRLAAELSKEIIDDGPFSIHNTGNPESDYRSLFQSADLTTNPEVIMPLIFQFGVRSNGAWASMFGDYETCPTKNLVQTYLMDDGSFYSSQSGWETKLFVEEFQNRDPRMSQTLVPPGWELIATETYAQQGSEGDLYVPRLAKNFTGYHQLKGFINIISNEERAGIDWPLFRYAEVLLTYAEARAELNEITSDDLDISINKLRSRAGMDPMPLLPAIDPEMARRYPLIADNALLLEIRRERQVELALEGYRFNDLMRWRAGKLLENAAKGKYFPGLGKYDLNGDGIPDIKLIDDPEIPVAANREKNELGVTLIYYRVGMIGENVDVFLEHGTHGCLVHIATMGTFEEPKHYFRPVPFTQVILSKDNLYQQFGWE